MTDKRELSDEEIAKRRDETIKRMIKMPPKTQKGEPKRAATGGAIAAKAAAGAWLACAALVLLSISAAAVVLAAFQSARDVG